MPDTLATSRLDMRAMTTLDCPAGGLAVADALRRVLALAPAPRTETVLLSQCAGRILAAPVDARIDLPRFDQSAMDGYAVSSAELSRGCALQVSGRTAAGEAAAILGPGQAQRILTGAPMPHGADTVIPQEHVRRDGDEIEIPVAPVAGSHVRYRGEDIHAGDLLVAAGTRLDWRHIAVLAAQGEAAVAVARRPVVALLSSGRELRAAGEKLGSGEVYDSNAPMLAALLEREGATVQRMPPVADDADAMRTALAQAADNADLVLSSAGISVGDEDHVRAALHHLGGALSVLKVAMKPGKPLAAGRLGNAVFLGLPGNPLAALAGAATFVRPLLARMAGADLALPMQAQAGFALKRKPGRTEFVLVQLRRRGIGLWADRLGADGAARLAPLLRADAFAIVAPERSHISSGDLVPIVPLVATSNELAQAHPPL